MIYFDVSNFQNQRPGYYGNVGKNTAIGPGLVKMDLSLLKNTTLAEGKTLQFRAESFNLFNTPELSQPSTGIDSATFGRISSSRLNSSRQFQLALVLRF